MCARWDKKHVEIRESVITLLGPEETFPPAVKALREVRLDLRKYIRTHRSFLDSLVPLPRDDSAAPIVRTLLQAGEAAGVGPMAGVAGAIAETCLSAMIRSGAKEAIVDNGGDMALAVTDPVVVGIYAGESQIRDLALKIAPTTVPLGISTSSGTVGHSFSMGRADAALVISEDIALADAAATALGNRVRSAEDLRSCFEVLEPLKPVLAGLVIFEDRIAIWGEVPELIRTRIPRELITRGRAWIRRSG